MSRGNFAPCNPLLILDWHGESCYTTAVLPLRREQFNCLYYFRIKYGFGIIGLLNCAQGPAGSGRECDAERVMAPKALMRRRSSIGRAPAL
jgi:hypothetical protein